MAEDAKILGEGKFVRLVAADGWEWAERTKVSGVIAVAAASHGKIILTEQYRRPLKANVIEVPAGLAGDSDDDAGKRSSEPPVVSCSKRRAMKQRSGSGCSTGRCPPA